MPRNTLLPFIFCSLVVLAIQPMLAQSGPTASSLAGSWEFTLTPTPGPMANPVAILIGGLATLTTDGSLVETDTTEVVPVQAGPGKPVVYGTPGHGIWQSGPAIGSWFVRFTSLVANSNGTLYAKRILSMTVMLNAPGNQFSGGYGFEVVDITGRVITTGSGSVTGQLMVHPALP